jgi:transcription-repair coupling factor (superfamily II helicase)
MENKIGLENIRRLYSQDKKVQHFLGRLRGAAKAKFNLKNLHGSSFSFLLAPAIEGHVTNHVVVSRDKEEAAYLHDDITRIIGEAKVCFFPASYRRVAQHDNVDNAGVILRTETLDRLASGETGLTIITYPEAIAEWVLNKEKLADNTLSLHAGEKISIGFIEEVLEEYGFSREDFVYGPGQYSIRGGIVDVFSFSSETPVRLDFFGDEVESIRAFDMESQLSTLKLDKITIVPNLIDIDQGTQRATVFEFLQGDSYFWINDLHFLLSVLEDINPSLEEAPGEKKDQPNILVPTEIIKEKLDSCKISDYSGRWKNGDEEFIFSTVSQPAFNKDFEILAGNLIEYKEKGYTIFLLSSNEKQIERLSSIFEEQDKEVSFVPVNDTVNEGFIDNDLGICVYTDHQIFERYHKYKLNTSFAKSEALTISELTGLHPGDYIVHSDHGIGKFGGLEKVEINGKMQETVRLVYKDNDILFVSIHNLHRVSKYKGKDGGAPKIYKLGTGAWQKLKQTTKKKVKDIARELIALYAKRKTSDGYAYAPDTYMQKELEASFIYEDTPDQLAATNATKEGMESKMPMDRLVCGDVGFGKTEVAIRAAFKAVADNKQVAVLVPTTILALQHFQTFSDRLKNFPCTVDYISRLKPTGQQKKTLSDLAAGKLDIIIGTHRLVGKDVQFRDLGLLIIDEEQKFGVKVKEKLRSLKLNVDTLTLTATPIPRTLQFSLMGARDLSIINTPPPNRYPIVTEVHTFNHQVIKEAIDYEVSRNGQVFFIHNRVQNINEVEAMVNKLCPGVKTIVAHGQMEGPKLEKIMLEFIRGDYDVLVATTIIESGLDIPRANTIIINGAQNFGLSDLHQLRGRVGRSNIKAFCYLMAPPVVSQTPEARRRLKAIEEFSELGSGFNIAMQDLDIRGAGNLLGAEQSGFIADIGFETYQRVLNEAIQELKEGEFQDLFEEERQKEMERQKDTYRFIDDCQIDTDLEILIPGEYVSNISERVKLYRELDNIQHEEKLIDFEKMLHDRFGPLPPATKELIDVVRLRWLAMQLGFEKIILKSGKMLIYFISNQMSPYYKSPVFASILQYVQNNPRKLKMKEGKDKLSMILEEVTTIYQAIDKVKQMRKNDTMAMVKE